MPTLGQILVVTEDWPTAVAIAGLPAPVAKGTKGHDIVLVVWHYYETKREIPSRNATERHARELDISIPEKAIPAWDEVIAAFKYRRAELKLGTPDDGPPPGMELTAEEVEALLAGARPKQRRGRWNELASVAAAFDGFVAECEQTGKKPTWRVYVSLRADRGWPGQESFKKHGTFTALRDAAVSRAAKAA